MEDATHLLHAARGRTQAGGTHHDAQRCAPKVPLTQASAGPATPRTPATARAAPTTAAALLATTPLASPRDPRSPPSRPHLEHPALHEPAPQRLVARQQPHALQHLHEVLGPQRAPPLGALQAARHLRRRARHAVVPHAAHALVVLMRGVGALGWGQWGGA